MLRSLGSSRLARVTRGRSWFMVHGSWIVLQLWLDTPSDRFCFNFLRLIGSGSWFCSPSGYLVCSSLITMVRFSSIRPPPLPHCIAHLLARSLIIIVQHAFG